MTKMIPPAPTSAVMMPTPKQKIGFSIESIVGNDAAPSTNSSSTTTTTTSTPPQTNLTMSPTSPTTQLHHHIGNLQHHHQHHHHNIQQQQLQQQHHNHQQHHNLNLSLNLNHIHHQTSPKSGDTQSSMSPTILHQNHQRPQDIQDIINRLQNTANLVNNSNNNNNSYSSYSPPLNQTRLSPDVPPLALHLKRERSPPTSSHGNLTPPISTSPSPSLNTTPNPINLNCSNNSNNYHNSNHSPSSSPNNLNHHHLRDSHSPPLLLSSSSSSTTTTTTTQQSVQQSQNSPNSIGGILSGNSIHSQFGGIGKGPIVVPGMPAGLIRPFPTVAGGPPNSQSSHQSSGQQSQQPDIKQLPPYINSPEMVPPQHHNPHLIAAAQFQMALQAGHVLGAAAAGLPPHSPFLPNHPGMPRDSYPLYPWLLSRHGRIFPHRFPGNFLLQPFRKPKRIRTAFSPSQLLKLEHAFESNQYVVGAERKALAQSLNLSETQVKVWFQNRRTKHKRMQQEDEKGGGGGNNGGSGNSSDRQNSCDDSDDELIDMEMDDCPSDDELDASH